MSTSAIFATAPVSSKEATTSAIFQGAPDTLNESTTSAIFVTEDGISAFTVFGAISSAPFVELFDPTSTFGTLSRDFFISPSQASNFGPVNSSQYVTVEDRGNTLRGSQFRSNTIGLDRFADSLTAVLAIHQDLDLTSATTTTIYTVPTGKTIAIIGCLIRIKSADTVSTDAEVSIGINPATDDIFSVEPLTAVQNVNNFYAFWQYGSVATVATSGQAIDLTVSTAATATTLNSDIYLIGSLF